MLVLCPTVLAMVLGQCPMVLGQCPIWDSVMVLGHCPSAASASHRCECCIKLGKGIRPIAYVHCQNQQVSGTHTAVT